MIATLALAFAAVTWPLDKLFTAPKTYDASAYATNGVEVTFYEGLPYKGKPTRVFAYYGVPKHAPGTKVPAMVLVHGGGGSAFYRWVKFWNDKGYAAISMDTCGKVSGNTIGSEQRQHYPHAWSGPAGWGGFHAMADADEDHWMYHAVAAVIRGHSFLRNLPDVDPERIGLTGVSWGGILTCIVGSLDTRFKFAAPVYGCGDNLVRAPAWEGNAKALGEKYVSVWREKWDPITYLPQATIPFHWLVGTNDIWFSLPSVENSRAAVKGVAGASIRVRMVHAHGAVSEQTPELIALADHYLRGGANLPQIGAAHVTNGVARATFAADAARKPVRAVLDYTTDEPDAKGFWASRRWRSAPACLLDGVVESRLPLGTRAFTLNLETTAGERASSRVVTASDETRRLQREIDAVAVAGGGRVTVTRGVHPCGTLYLRSNVELHLEDGAELRGGTRPEDYDDAIPLSEVYSYKGAVPATVTRKAFIYAENATNIAITGKGTINGCGQAFFNQKTWAKPTHLMRPRMVVFMNCRDIRLADATFKDCPLWHFWLRKCSDIVVSRIRIDADKRMINTDGIDFDVCRNVRVGDSTISTGDDCVVLRAIRHGLDAKDAVTENVIVSNCTLSTTCQGVRIACASDYAIRNALFRDIVFTGRNAIFANQEKRYLEEGNFGNLTTAGLVFENWRIDCSGYPISAAIDPGVRLTDFGHLTFRNIDIRAEKPIRIFGNETSRVRDVVFENVTGVINARDPFVHGVTEGLKTAGLRVRSALKVCDWLAPADMVGATNVTYEFRAAFTAPRAGMAELAVSADAAYAVRLNGREVVATARLPDALPFRFFDVWKLDAIRPGTNELAFSVYAPGVNTSHCRVNVPGLRFALAGEGYALSSSDAIETRRSTADIAEGVPLTTSQLGFSFHYDATRPPAAWRTLTATERLKAKPGETLERRPVAPSATLPFVAAKIVATSRLDGSPAPDSPSVGMDKTPHTPCAVGTTADPALFKNGFSYLLDIGREEAGLFEMEIDTDAGAVIDIGHAEHAENNRIAVKIGGRNFAGRYRAKEGLQTFCRWQYRMAGRYLQLDVRGVKTRFTLKRVGVRPVIRTDVTERPVPNELNARRQAIWKTAVRTLRLSMHEHYEDCPWREQSLYGNDGRNQILAGRFAFENDSAFAAHSLDLMLRGLDPADCWLEMCMPGRTSITIPSFTFSTLLGVSDHWRLYRDRATATRLWPMVKTILARRIGEMREGLLPCPVGKRYWQFYDWASGLTGYGAAPSCSAERRFEAPLNILFLQALERADELAAAAGEDTAGAYRAVAAKLRPAIVAKFWNAEKVALKTFADEARNTTYHELTQSLALQADCVPLASRKAVAKKLSARSEWVETTLSQSLQKYEALIGAGDEFKSVVLAQVDAEWGRMLDAGATSFWEVREGWRAFSNAGSLCHGWSAIPIYVYAKLLPTMSQR